MRAFSKCNQLCDFISNSSDFSKGVSFLQKLRKTFDRHGDETEKTWTLLRNMFFAVTGSSKCPACLTFSAFAEKKRFLLKYMNWI